MPNQKTCGSTSDIYESCTRNIVGHRFKSIGLEELDVNSCNVQVASLISLLQNTPFLRSLTLSNLIKDRHSSINSVVQMLAQPMGQHENPLSFPICCPRLQYEYVNFSDTHDLKAELIVRLVRSRLTSMRTAADSEADTTPLQTDSENLPLPIVSLDLECCPEIDEDHNDISIPLPIPKVDADALR